MDTQTQCTEFFVLFFFKFTTEVKVFYLGVIYISIVFMTTPVSLV